LIFRPETWRAVPGVRGRRAPRRRRPTGLRPLKKNLRAPARTMCRQRAARPKPRDDIELLTFVPGKPSNRPNRALTRVETELTPADFSWKFKCLIRLHKLCSRRAPPVLPVG